MNHESIPHLQAKNDTLKWVDYITMSYIMMYDVKQINPSFEDKFTKAMATMTAFIPLITGKTITIDTINANAADMLKKGEALYNATAKAAKAAGAPVLVKVPSNQKTTPAPNNLMG